MSGVAVLDRRMTIREFLEFDDGTDTRYELRGGRLVAMNPPRPPHALLANNIGYAIRQRSPDPARGDRSCQAPDKTCAAGRATRS